MHVRFTGYCLVVIKFFTLYLAKYIKKKWVSNLLAQECATFHSTFISHTEIGGKLENILNKLLKKHTVHVLHQIAELTTHLLMFPNKDTPCGQENEVIQERSRDVPDVVDKKRDCFLVCFVQNVRYLIGT